MVFEWFHFFHLFIGFVSWGRDLSDILVSFGDLGDNFSDIWRCWEQAWNLMDFQGFPGGAEILRPPEVEGKLSIQGGTQST